MAMMKCPECGKEFSEYAEMCPNCGITKKKIEELKNREYWLKNYSPKIKEYLNDYGALSIDEFRLLGLKLDYSVRIKLFSDLVEKGELKITTKEHGMHNELGKEIDKKLYFLAEIEEEEAIEKRKHAPDVLEVWDKKILKTFKEDVRDKILDYTSNYKVWNDTIKEYNKKLIFGENNTDVDSYIKIAIHKGDLECKKINYKNYYCQPNLSEEEFTDYKEMCDNITREIKEKKQEYQNRLNNFMQKASQPRSKCPTCGSTNVSTISQTNSFLSVAFWGGASSNIGKTKKCNNCGYKW